MFPFRFHEEHIPVRPRSLLTSVSQNSSCNKPSFNYIRSMPQTPPVVLTIAGFDPSSGAGITADIKTIAAHGCFGVAALTAVTVQSTSGVKRSDPVDVALLRETLEE